MKSIDEMTLDDLAQENKRLMLVIAEAQERQKIISAEVASRGVERRKAEALKMLAVNFPDLVVRGEGKFTAPPEKLE